MILCTFDFDRTITCKHTFPTTKIDEKSVLTFYPEEYLKGQQDAIKNVKKGVSEYIIHDDGEHSSAIATFHNNHSMVAGYISAISGKNLTFEENHLSESGFIAIAQYKIDGIEKPFFISYINAYGSNFSTTLFNLNKNKNEQLNHLRQTVHKLYPDQESIEIIHYDDDMNNCEQAALLPSTTVFLINANISKTFVYQPWQASLKLEQSTDSLTSSSSSQGFFSHSAPVITSSSSEPSDDFYSIIELVRTMIVEERHDEVEEYRIHHNINPSFIAGFYAEAANHDKVEMYREKHKASVNVITQAYAFAGNHGKVAEYQIRFNLTEDFIQGCFQRALDRALNDAHQASGPGL